HPPAEATHPTAHTAADSAPASCPLASSTPPASPHPPPAASRHSPEPWPQMLGHCQTSSSPPHKTIPDPSDSAPRRLRLHSSTRSTSQTASPNPPDDSAGSSYVPRTPSSATPHPQ